jgi:hypothetical protein
MSGAVCIHKTIWNGHLDPVTCTYMQTAFDAVRRINLDHESFIYERDVSIAFSYMAKKRKTSELSDGFNDKLKNYKLTFHY